MRVRMIVKTAFVYSVRWVEWEMIGYRGGLKAVECSWPVTTLRR